MTNLYRYFAFEQDGFLFRHSVNSGISYSAVDKKIAQICNLLHDLGIQKQDRIIQQTDKSIDAFCLYLAVIRMGAIYIPLNPAFTLEEVSYFIGNARPKLFVCNSQQEKSILNLAQKIDTHILVKTLNLDGSGNIQENAALCKEEYHTVDMNENDIACILYTSGTTGKPKGAMLSHKNLLSNAKALVSSWKFSQQDVLLHTLPIFHCHGLFFASHCVLMSGASMYFEDKFEVEKVKKLLPLSTVFMGVPTYYHRLLEDQFFTQELTQNIRLFISGSAPLLPITFSDFKHRTGHEILERYGMTETGINTSNPLEGKKIIGSVGTALSKQSVKIVDSAANECAMNEIGSILVKGDNVFCGYWEKPNTEYFSDDGYFITGDLGKLDENGYLYIVGRNKDIIITGGLNVYAKEVETVINDISGIKESAVIGAPHADFGEAVIAIVVLHDTRTITPQEIIEVTRKALANYKIPKKVIFAQDLPRNTMGKVQKNVLREQYKNTFSQDRRN